MDNGNQKVQRHSEGGKEYWRDVLDYEGYYRVSDWGRVKALPRRRSNGFGTYMQKGKILRQTSDGSRFLVNLTAGDGMQKVWSVHHLVLRAFVGLCPSGMECCHWDGNPLNNRLKNLRWDTHKNNEADKRRHGTALIGERTRTAKLTRFLVRKIRRLYMTGEYSYGALVKLFGITVGTLSPLLHGKTWDRPDCYPPGYVFPPKRTHAECFAGVNRWSGVGCKKNPVQQEN